MDRDYLIIGAGLVAVGVLFWLRQQPVSDNPQDESLIDSALTLWDETVSSEKPDLESMSTSEQMLQMLMRHESYSATPYQLDDGAGMTWGYGHKGTSKETPPSYISKADAYALFRQDVVNRAEHWVKLYVNIDLSQNEFDALVSIAFNMSPQSFKKFAASVNDGQGIDGIAQESVSWVKPQYTRGIQRRRNDEMRVFNEGIYQT